MTWLTYIVLEKSDLIYLQRFYQGHIMRQKYVLRASQAALALLAIGCSESRVIEPASQENAAIQFNSSPVVTLSRSENRASSLGPLQSLADPIEDPGMIISMVGDADNFGWAPQPVPCTFFERGNPAVDLGVFDREETGTFGTDRWTHDFRTDSKFSASFRADSIRIEIPEIFSDITNASFIQFDNNQFNFIQSGTSRCGPSVVRVFMLRGQSAAIANDGLVNVFFSENGDDIALDYSRMTVWGKSTVIKIAPVGGTDIIAPELPPSAAPTLTLRVGLYGPDGKAIPNQSVDLTLGIGDENGGHSHVVNRPFGSIDNKIEMPVTVNTGPSGEIDVTYRPPKVGGDVKVIGQSQVLVNSVPTTIRGERPVHVKIDGLGALSGPFTFIGATTTHPVNHYGTPDFNAALVALGTAFQAEYLTTIKVNDMSLVFGGLFDIKADWSSPHAEHKLGRNADVQTTGALSTAQQNWLRIKWESLGGSVHDETASANHFHLRY